MNHFTDPKRLRQLPFRYHERYYSHQLRIASRRVRVSSDCLLTRQVFAQRVTVRATVKFEDKTQQMNQKHPW